MSVKLMAQVWDLDLPQSIAWVLMAYADHADDDGRCWPGVDRIAYKTGLSDRQVQRIKKDLIGQKIIVVEYGGKGGSFVDRTGKHRGSTDHIRLDFSQVKRKAPFAPKDKMSPLKPTSDDFDDDCDDMEALCDDTMMSPESSVEPSGEPSFSKATASLLPDDDESLPDLFDVCQSISAPLPVTVTASNHVNGAAPAVVNPKPTKAQRDALFDALKNLCQIDTSVKNNASHCAGTMNQLLNAKPPYYAENISVNFTAYWNDSWRGKGPPTLGQVLQHIGVGGRYVPGQIASSANGNGARASPSEQPDPPAQEKLRVLRDQQGRGVREA